MARGRAGEPRNERVVESRRGVGSRESSCGTEGYMAVYYVLGPARYIRLRHLPHRERKRAGVCMYISAFISMCVRESLFL